MADFTKEMQQLQELVNELYLRENKRYTAAGLLPRFKTAADNNRHDLTINQAAFVIEQVANKDPHKQISANDLRELGDQFYQNGTQYTIEFSDLLEEKEEETQKESGRLDYEGAARDIEFDGAHEREIPDLYSENNNGVVDPSISYSPEELALFQQAAQMIDDEFQKTGRISKVSSVLKIKHPDKLIFQTSIRTADTAADVFVPVEVSANIPLFPEVMSTTEKVYTIDSNGLDELTSDVQQNVELKRANHVSNLRSADDYDFALRDDNMGKFAHEVDEFEELQPKHNLGVEEIEKVLTDAVLAKDSKYSTEAQTAGRELVESELRDLGVQNPQVAFSGDYEHGLTYTAEINTGAGKVSITVPVENNNTLLLPPTQFAATGGTEVFALTKEALSTVGRVAEATMDVHPFLHAMSYPDLRKQLKSAAVDKKHKLAQQIISLIDEKFGDYYRNAATDDYQSWLEESIQSYQSRCGDCTYYVEKTASTEDYCNLIKTAAKEVSRDEDAEICTRSTYADLENSSVYFDSGQSITITWDDE